MAGPWIPLLLKMPYVMLMSDKIEKEVE